MIRSLLLSALLCVCLIPLSACGPDEEDQAKPERAAGLPASQTPPSATAPEPIETTTPEQWTGKWDGPEGTYINIEAVGETSGYNVTIANLDGPRTFEGAASNNRIQFERDGKTEFVRAGTGADTGMKWLADKKTCLVIKSGEGYCRD